MLYHHSAGGMDFLKSIIKKKKIPIKQHQIYYWDRVSGFQPWGFLCRKKKDESTSPIWTLSNEDKSPFKCRVVLGIKRRKVSFRVHVGLWKCQPPQFLPAPPLSTATQFNHRCRARLERCFWLWHLFLSHTTSFVVSHSDTGFNFCVIAFISVDCSSEARVYNDTLWRRRWQITAVTRSPIFSFKRPHIHSASEAFIHINQPLLRHGKLRACADKSAVKLLLFRNERSLRRTETFWCD